MASPLAPGATSPEGLAGAARALRAVAETRRLAADLDAAGIRALALKGPLLQQRLYGTPAAYPSGDVDVLVPAPAAAAARRAMEGAGWVFEPGNGVLWRLSRAATYERDGVRVDLHWGLHAAHLPARTLTRLEEDLWEGAAPGDHGLFEPLPEPLLVFLALHAAGHRFERPHWVENVARAAGLVGDWERVWAIARRARVEGAVRHALDVAAGRARPRPRPRPLLDGWWGQVQWGLAWVGRGHVLPRGARAALAAGVARLTGRGRVATRFAGIDLVVDPGVFPPQPVSEGLVRLALEGVASISTPVIADVGTGSGAVALAIATARPDAEVHALDVSRRVLTCARRNARAAGATSLQFHRCSLLDRWPADRRLDTVVGNVPYVHPDTPLPDGVDPASIRGLGLDGLDLVRRLARQAAARLVPGGWLVLQVADSQWDGLADELAAMGYVPLPPDERRPGRALVGRARFEGRDGA